MSVNQEGTTTQPELCFNNIIKNRTVEESLLFSYLVPLPNLGKDHTKLKGYQVITVQNTVGKLLRKDNCKEIIMPYSRV